MTAPAPAVVTTTAGAVCGRRTELGVEFHDVPYAAPPVGPLRFAAPAPHPGWTGVRDADTRGPGVPQTPTRLERAVGPIGVAQSEAGLGVDVWTPGLHGRRPVLVWLHGGGFSSGSGAQDWFVSDRLAARGDLVVVTVNYRLGALGYLRVADLAPDRVADLAPGFGAGNQGLLDQLAALRWVRDNVAAFGGDPDRVTLAGQSAGALSALALMSAPDAAGLFGQVVLQSTPTGVRPASPDAAADVAGRFLHALDLRPADVHRLAMLPVERVLAAQGEVVRQVARPLLIAPPFQLVAAPGLVAPDLVAASRATGVRRLVGSTRDEARAFTVPDERLDGLGHDEARALAATAFGPAGPDAYARLRATTPAAAPGDVLAALVSEDAFGGVQRLATGPGAYVYRFDWHPAGNPFRACHCLELPFVFGNLDAWRDAAAFAGADRAEASALVDRVQDAWTAFVTTGDPGFPAGPDARTVLAAD